MTDILSIQPTLRTLTVRHPASGEPVGLEIDFRSLDSDEVQVVERQMKAKALRGGRNTTTVDKLEEGEYAILHALTAGWRWSNGMTLAGDAKPELTRVNTEKLYRIAPWIKKQLNDELKDESGFFLVAEKPSSKA